MIKGRYWLLDSAVEHGVPLSVLTAPNMEEALNRKGHGLSAEEIVGSIARMLDAGELRISLLESPGARWRRFGQFAEDRILELIKRQPDHPDFIPSGYHLTKSGGAEWENWAQPDWSRYNSGWAGIRAGSSIHTQAILAATAPLAHELLELEKLLHRDREIVPGSVKLKVLRPWRATYWKTLAEGFEFRFRSKPSDATRHGAWDRWRELNRWYDRPEF